MNEGEGVINNKGSKKWQVGGKSGVVREVVGERRGRGT